MNKTKKNGNMYDFIDYTYNPIKGLCQHKCSYCYAATIIHRFKQDPTLRLSEKELQSLFEGNRHIFVGSSIDMFAADIPPEWIERTLDQIAQYPHNGYLLQTKNPNRYHEFISHPVFANGAKNIVFCTTIESDINYPYISKAPTISERIDAMIKLSDLGYKTMLTVEPIMKFSSPEMFATLLASIRPKLVNIGANTSRTVKLPEPTADEVAELIKLLQNRGLRVHKKSNLERILKA